MWGGVGGREGKRGRERERGEGDGGREKKKIFEVHVNTHIYIHRVFGGDGGHVTCHHGNHLLV